MADTANPLPSTDPLLNRFFLTAAEKADKEKGKAIMKAFYSEQTSNATNLNFFRARNARLIELLLWCKGSQKMQEFFDYLDISDANKAWVNIDSTPTRLAAQFIGTLIESMAKNKTYPCVSAIDNGSMSEKEDRLFDALFRMHEVETIKQVQQQSGIMVEPPNAYIPDDEMSAKVYFKLEDRLPKEIRFEELLRYVQKEIKFERVTNRKSLADLVVCNLGATKIERIGPGQYIPRKCIPTNLVYNFFVNDSGDCEITKAGEFCNIKVKDFRPRFGKSPDNPDGLTEKEIFELAKLSTNKSIGIFNYMWSNDWASTTYNLNRPYDDCSILVLDAEIDCGEDIYYVEKTDAFGKLNITQKKTIPYQQKTKDGGIIEQPKPDNVDIIKRQKNTWMRGVYAPYGDKILYWGRPDLIISQYTNTARPLSSYTFNIPGNDGEYVPSLAERMMEPLREYQITKLKRKQLIALIKPSGIRIDVESARNLDLGNGDTIEWETVLKIYNQTGCEVWSSKGVDPLQREGPPLSNTVQDTSIEKIIGLTNVLLGIVNEIRQLVGVPMYRDGSDVGDRTAAKLAEGQNESASNVTDYILNGNNQLWEETFYKICLLHWNDIVKEEPESKDDLLNTRFDLSIKTKATDYEKQLLEQDIQRYSQMPDAQGNPSLSMKDALMLREIEDYKLACWYLESTFNKNRQRAIEQSERLQAQNAAVQQQSAQQEAQQEAQQMQMKLQVEAAMKEAELRGKEKLEIITGIFAVAQKMPNGELPDYLKPLAAEAISNIMMPLMIDNQEVRAQMAQHTQQASQDITGQSAAQQNVPQTANQ